MTIRDIFEPIQKEPEPAEASNHELEGQVIEGKVIKVLDKGFGFIVSPALKYTRIFFHWSALNQDTLNFAELKKGAQVRFTLKKFPKSWRAIKIEVLKNGGTDERTA